MKGLKELMKLFSKRPDGHYEFRVSEGVVIDNSVFEKWDDKKEIVYAVRSQVVRAKERANKTYDWMISKIDGEGK